MIIDTIKYKWDYNKNNFIDDKNKLPEHLTRKIYTDFIFKDFLKMFRRFLSFNVKNLKDQDDKIYNSLLNLNFDANVVV